MADRSLLDARTTIPDEVVFQEVKGQAALLHLDTEIYFGLEEVGTRMWQELSAGGTIGEAASRLAEFYDAPASQVQADLIDLVQELQKHKLLDVHR